MKIQAQDLYYGAVLTQITEHPSFTALSKADSQLGHYVVNHEIRLTVKYSSIEFSPWQFDFSPAELQSIKRDMQTTDRVYLCLMCGQETICALNLIEFTSLIDLNSFEYQPIVVEAPTNDSMYVSGTVGKLPRTLSHNSFPSKIFQSVLDGVGNF